MADAWGGSWGGAWADSWGGAAAAVVPARGGGYGGTQDRKPHRRRDYEPPARAYDDERRRKIAARHVERQRADLAIPAEIDKRIGADAWAEPATEPAVAAPSAPPQAAPAGSVIAPFAELFAGPVRATMPALPQSRADGDAMRRAKIAAAEMRIALRARQRDEDDIEVILLTLH